MSCEKSCDGASKAPKQSNINYIILLVLYILLAIILGAVIY